MLFSFLDCVLQALGSACVQTDGCAINLAASPVQSLRCKPSAYLHGSFTRQGEKCTKKRKKKSPRQSLLIILFTVIILKRGTQKYKQKVLVLFIFLQPTQETVFRPSFAKSKLGNEWHLKTRNGLLTPDFVWRSPCSSLWFRDGFIIPLLTFFFSSSSPLKLNDKLWNFVVCLFLMWVLKNDNMPNACDRAFPPPTPSSLPVSCCGSSSRLTAPSFQNILVSVLRPSLSSLAAVCFTAWSVFAE